MAAARTHPFSVGRVESVSAQRIRSHVKCSSTVNDGVAYRQPSSASNCRRRAVAAGHHRRRRDAAAAAPSVSAAAPALAPAHRTARPAHDVACRVSTSSSSPSPPGGTTASVTVAMQIHAQLDYGQKLGVVGDAALFGGWNPKKPYLLRWTEGDVWTGTMELPAVGEIEYKLIVSHGEGGFEWEQFHGGNRVLELLPGGSYVKIQGEINQELQTTKAAAPPPKPEPLNPTPAPPPPPSQAPDVVARGADGGTEDSEAEAQQAMRRNQYEEAEAGVETRGKVAEGEYYAKGQSTSRDFYAEAKARAPGGGGGGAGGYSSTSTYDERAHQEYYSHGGGAGVAGAPSTTPPKSFQSTPLQQQQQQWQRQQYENGGAAAEEAAAAAQARNARVDASFQERVQQALAAAEHASNAAYSASAEDSYTSYYDSPAAQQQQQREQQRQRERQRQSSRDFYAEAKARAEAFRAVAPPPPSPWSSPSPNPYPNPYPASHGASYPPPPEEPSFDGYPPPPPGMTPPAQDHAGYYSNPPASPPDYAHAPAPPEPTYAYDAPAPSPPPPPPPLPPPPQPEPAAVPADFSNLPEGTCRAIAEGDAARRSWLEKLQLVGGVIAGPSSRTHYRGKARRAGGTEEVEEEEAKARGRYTTGAQSEEEGRATPDAGAVAACGVYLRWLGTCVVRCGEDDGLQPPDAAATAARDIFVSLETAFGELYTPGRAEVGEVDRALMRLAQIWLPSLDAEFVQGVPLARAAAITQRGDVPEPLRDVVRESVVKKLMRNAGPEGLYTAEELLRTVASSAAAAEATGVYPLDVVDELSAYVQELKRYFNRSGAMDRLYALRGELDDDLVMIVDELRDAMGALAMAALGDGGGPGGEGLTGAEGACIVRALRAATAVRGRFTAQLSSTASVLGGTRDDVTGLVDDAAVRRRQAYRLAEISLEELAFVLLTRALHCAGVKGESVEAEGVVAAEDGGAFERALLSDVGEGAWTSSCAAVAQALRHIALSTWRPMECHSVARELEAWCQAAAASGGGRGAGPGGTGDGAGTPVATHEDALRMRASLERAQRLVRAHSTALTEGYGRVPIALGAALNVPTRVSASYVDAAVRGSVPYQLSRLLAPMLRAAARAAAARGGAGGAGAGAGLGPGLGLGAGAGLGAGLGLEATGAAGASAPSTAVVAGRGVGRLVECAALEPGAAGKARDGPVVAFVWRAEGNEEVTAAGRHVRGIVLAQELRRTTRLAARAAQERVPLTATGGGEAAERAARAARDLLGEWVALEVTPDGVRLGPATPEDVADAQRVDHGGSAFATTRVAAVKLTDRLECRPLREATEARAGAKAAACAHLLRVAERPGSGFRALGGVYIPFGAMEACLRAAGRGDELARLVAAVESAAQVGNSLMIDAACRAARELIAGTPFPPEMAATLCAAFPLPSDDDDGAVGGGRLVVRSSANVEDLAGMSGAGLYSSVLGVPAQSSRELGRAVSRVWASLFTRAAAMNRLAAGVPQTEARMAVFVQEMAPSDVSFVLHTAGGGADGGPAMPGAFRASSSSSSAAAAAPPPRRGWYGNVPSSGVLDAEIAVGLGETAAAAAGERERGSPWRLQAGMAFEKHIFTLFDFVTYSL